MLATIAFGYFAEVASSLVSPFSLGQVQDNSKPKMRDDKKASESSSYNYPHKIPHPSKDPLPVEPNKILSSILSIEDSEWSSQ